MSTYATQEDILGYIQYPELVQLTDEGNPPTGDIDSAVLGRVITNASGVIDRMVGNVYDVPFASPPPSVVSLCAVITAYNLYRRREVPDEKNKFAEDCRLAMDMLKAVNKREQFLDLAANQDFPQVAVNAGPTIFGWGNHPTTSK